MNKALKISGISILSLLGVIIVALLIAMWFIFTPSKLTPIVRKQANKLLNCEVKLDTVDLTFFSTFPQFGLHVKNLTLINPVDGAPNDTLAHIEDFTAAIDLKAYRKKGAIILNEFYLKNGKANIYIDSLGHDNYSIYNSSENSNDTSTTKMPQIDLQKVVIDNLQANYIDKRDKMSAKIQHFSTSLNAQYNTDGNGSASGKITIQKILFATTDSTKIYTNIENLSANLDGKLINNNINGRLKASAHSVSFAMNDTSYLDTASIQISMPLSVNLKEEKLSLANSTLGLNDLLLNLSGWVQSRIDSSIALNINFTTGEWTLNKVFALIPKAYKSMLDGLDFDADVTLSGNVAGIYNDSTMPLITTNLKMANGHGTYESLPYKISNANADMNLALNMNENATSDITIHSFSTKADNNTINGRGTIKDALNSQYCDLYLGANVQLNELKPMLPDDLILTLKGQTKGTMHIRGYLNDMENANLDKLKAIGTFDFKNFDATYDDSMRVQASTANLNFTLPSPDAKKNTSFKELVHAKLTSPDLRLDMIDSTTTVAKGSTANLTIGISDFMDTTVTPSVSGTFAFDRLKILMDTISADMDMPKGTYAYVTPKKHPNNPVMQISYESNTFKALDGNYASVNTKHIAFTAKAAYDESQKNLLLQWNPELKVNLTDGNIEVSNIKYPLNIPNIDFSFTPKLFYINKGKFLLGRSDFNLNGSIENFDKYFKKEGLLEGNLAFTSDYTDVNQLMDLFNGMGNSDSTKVEPAQTETTNAVDTNPFMVPKGVDVELVTQIKKAYVNKTIISNVRGTLGCNDGTLALDQMGFTTDAGKMQLSTIYRSPRSNHLYVYLDLHLLDVNIGEMYNIVPDLDTVVPMLKYFKGKAELHLAAETNLKSNYDIKYSTLLGALDIEGKNLVLLSNETFNKACKYHLISRKSENMIDSMDVQFALHKDKVDVYPFLISMDKYKIVVGGRYDLSQNYDAHIETLAPVRLALQVNGNTNSTKGLKYKLVKKKYTNMYNPQKATALQERTLTLKKLISESLKKNVKRETLDMKQEGQDEQKDRKE